MKSISRGPAAKAASMFFAGIQQPKGHCSLRIAHRNYVKMSSHAHSEARLFFRADIVRAEARNLPISRSRAVLQVRMTGKVKSRLDLLLLERGLAPSRERARALILEGKVLVNEQKVDKPGTTIAVDAAIRMLGEDLPYVSRGGLKLAAAFDHWQLAVSGRGCVDVGASTGGFTDCLLQRGAAYVTAIDTGFGQIALKLRDDPRVRLLERTNARFLEPGSLEEGRGAPALTLLVMDVSFISATLLLEPVFAAAPHLEEAVILVKPQFEAGREHVGKGGIVRDEAAHQMAIDRVTGCVASLGWEVVGTIPSPITGAEGNREFLLYARNKD
jgi:23S rRNA (cytidine1920-2'-O)/16S rRNA (cytidine1409-2'-O)-methyltransferase